MEVAKKAKRMTISIPGSYQQGEARLVGPLRVFACAVVCGYARVRFSARASA